jgi:type II secretory pathway pseudopilin PulG
MKLATANKLPIAPAMRDQLPIECRNTRRDKTIGNSSAFTLAEVLAAMLLLAIVIPAAVEALHVSSLAGEVAARKGAAARIADRVLNESIVLTNWNNGVQSGTAQEGVLDFHWTLTSQAWPQDTMQLLTAEVTYQAQGKDYSVKLSTLTNPQTPPGQPAQPASTMSLR